MKSQKIYKRDLSTKNKANWIGFHLKPDDAMCELNVNLIFRIWLLLVVICGAHKSPLVRSVVY